jgi:seryl-tRNA synthetase
LQHDFKSLNEDLKRDLNKNQDTIEKLIASKADKKSQAVAVEKINAAIKPLQKELKKLTALRQDLKTVSDVIKKMESQLTSKLEALIADTQQHGKDYDQLQASLTELSNNTTELSKKTVDKDVLALEVFKLKKNFQNQISKEVTNINQRLDSIQIELDDNKKISGTQKQSLKKVSKKAVSQDSGAALPAQSGDITEKDLIE